MGFPPEQIRDGTSHLRRADPVLGALIDRVGPFQMKLYREPFRMLVYSIISQQISTAAAAAIRKRLLEKLGAAKLSPRSLASLSISELRTCGVSPQKSAYLHDLAQKVLDKKVRLRSLHRRTDEEIIEELTQVKGIGTWTAQMFLMFSLGRLDVFPHQDLGIRVALKRLYGLPDLPDKQRSHDIAAAWRPFTTVGCWYCWRSLELKPETSN